jgi:hypothetical protein
LCLRDDCKGYDCMGPSDGASVAADPSGNPTDAELTERITEYLSAGGLFNPELMESAKVRDLLIDCRTALAGERTPRRQRPSVGGGDHE